MKISQQAQEQLEQLWIIEEEQQKNHPEQPNTAAVFQELVQLKLVKVLNNLVQLTPHGKLEASQAIRRHRLAERLLVDVLVTEESLVDIRACDLEHALVDGIEESICTLLGHPKVCPHGKPIPQGHCCKQNRLSVSPLITSLCDLKAGQKGKIAYLHLHNSQQLRKLMGMGVLPGAAVKVKSVYPTFVFDVGYSQFAVDEEIASEIFIRLENTD